MTERETVSHHFIQRRAAFAFFFIGLCSDLAQGHSIDQRPRPTILLTKSPQFIAQDAWNSVALYGFNDSEPLRKFPAGASINQFEATADDQLLLVACGNGEIGVWNIGTGDKLWWHTPSRSGLGYIYGASFSWDGKSLVACNYSDFALIFDAFTGKQIGKVSFPPMQTHIMSATLSPDGRKGAFVDLGERLFTFDTNTGLMKDTGLKGAWPVRFSADGKYIALRSNNFATDERLRLVAVKDLSMKDAGQFGHIAHIKPMADGSFLVCAHGRESGTVGVEYRPDSGELKEVWRLSSEAAENRTDFDTRQLIGVSTNFHLVTRLIDLRTGKPRLTIDNSANYLPQTDLSWLVVVGVGVALARCVVAYFLKSKRTKAPPS
jgi:hypothetical protein